VPVVYVPLKAFRFTKGSLHYCGTPSLAAAITSEDSVHSAASESQEERVHKESALPPQVSMTQVSFARSCACSPSTLSRRIIGNQTYPGSMGTRPPKTENGRTQPTAAQEFWCSR
jgi:hypothetical protein